MRFGTWDFEFLCARASQRSPSLTSKDGLKSGRTENFMDRFAVVDFEAFVAGDFELSGIEAELMENGRMDVRDIMSVLDGVEA